MGKKRGTPTPTPGKQAYLVQIRNLAAEYEDYSKGEASDDYFPTPAKQRKVAKQLAKAHNRLLKKVPEFDLDELEEDL